MMCWVKFLQDCDVYGNKCRLGEVLLLHHDHANELAVLQRAVILKTTQWETKTIINHIKDLLRQNPVIKVFDLLEEAVTEEVAREGASKKFGKGKEIIWIEHLHEKPIADGRHRVIDLIFIPYLKNQLNVSEDEAIKWIMTWLEECDKLRHTDINPSYVRQKFRRCP